MQKEVTDEKIQETYKPIKMWEPHLNYDFTYNVKTKTKLIMSDMIQGFDFWAYIQEKESRKQILKEVFTYPCAQQHYSE